MNSLNKEQQRECKALARWAKAKGFTIDALAEVMELDYSNVYRIVTGRRPVNDAFKWRFAQAFGWEVADEVFSVARIPVEA